LASGGRRMYFSRACRPYSSAGPARVAACKLKPASRTESGASMATQGRPAKASSRGLRRSSAPAGARPETAAAASCAKGGSRSASSSETQSTSLSASESRVEVHYTSIVGVGDAKLIDVYAKHGKSKHFKAKQHCDIVLKLRARFGDLAAAVVFHSHKSNEEAARDPKKKRVDLFGVSSEAEITKTAERAEREQKAAHKAWRATGPKKKEKDAKRSYQVPEAPLPHVA
jgi:hypothetical protein